MFYSTDPWIDQNSLAFFEHGLGNVRREQIPDEVHQHVNVGHVLLRHDVGAEVLLGPVSGLDEADEKYALKDCQDRGGEVVGHDSDQGQSIA